MYVCDFFLGCTLELSPHDNNNNSSLMAELEEQSPPQIMNSSNSSSSGLKRSSSEMLQGLIPYKEGKNKIKSPQLDFSIQGEKRNLSVVYFTRVFNLVLDTFKKRSVLNYKPRHININYLINLPYLLQ